MHDTTRLLSAIEQGDGQAAKQLLPLIYDELHRLAAELVARERPGQTLEATALVNEAYLRLVEPTQTQHWHGRADFFGAAAEAMRRILVENARWRRARKHGGGWHRVPLDRLQVPEHEPQGKRAEDIFAVDEALERFAAEDPVKAELVKLRYFVGLSIKEAAGVLGISRITAERYWSYARVWLYAELTRDDSAAGVSERHPSS
jgi:RNA polymerase sigma factor (TIGR02999 family)